MIVEPAMKNKRTYLVLIIVLLLSFINTACMWTEEDFIDEATKYMELKYKESFGMASMYEKDEVIMSLNKNQKIRVVARYADFDEDGKKEWHDNYLYYLRKDEMYKDIKEIVDTVYENNKIYIKIDRITMPNTFTVETDIVELYKRGTFNVYIYTDKDILDREEDVLKLKQGMSEKQMECMVCLVYLRNEDFVKMSEDNIDKVSIYKIYNAEVYFFAHKKDEELKWEYGEFEKDLE